MIIWVITIFLILWPLLSGLWGRNSQHINLNNKANLYLKDIFINSIVLVIIYFISREAYYRLDFEVLGKGVLINQNILSGIIPIFFIPLILSLLGFAYNYPRANYKNKEIFGYPLIFFPNSLKEYFLFCIYIIIGVIFEELICRQFMFFYFNKTLGLRGDILLISSTSLFALGHLYQGWKGVLSAFILGIIFGKIFQMTETILYPMILHLAMNFTVLIIAARRLVMIRRRRTNQ